MKVPCQGFQKKKKNKATKTSNVLSLRTLIKKSVFWKLPSRLENGRCWAFFRYVFVLKTSQKHPF